MPCRIIEVMRKMKNSHQQMKKRRLSLVADWNKKWGGCFSFQPPDLTNQRAESLVMSGSGRKTGYRKSVQDEYLYGNPLPEDGKQVVQVTGLRGNNIFEVTTSNGECGLAMLPAKFKKLIWVKRGNYVLVSGGEDTEDAVKYIIENILDKDQIKHIKQRNLWPEEFVVEARSGYGFRDTDAPDNSVIENAVTENGDGCGNGDECEEEESEEDDDALPLHVNHNRRVMEVEEEEEDSDSD